MMESFALLWEISSLAYYTWVCVFAARNKIQLLEQRIMGHILPYMKSDNSIVTSKLVGVVRLLIDGQGRLCLLKQVALCSERIHLEQAKSSYPSELLVLYKTM